MSRPPIDERAVPMGELLPVIYADDHTIGSLMTALLTDEIAVPVWVQFFNTKHKVTEENKEGVCKGLLIALEMKEPR